MRTTHFEFSCDVNREGVYSHGNITNFNDHLIWIRVFGIWSNLFTIQMFLGFAFHCEELLCFSSWLSQGNGSCFQLSQIQGTILAVNMFSLSLPDCQSGCGWVCASFMASLMGTEGLSISVHCKWFQTFEGPIVNIWFKNMSWLKGHCCIVCIGSSTLLLYCYHCFLRLK